MPHSQVVYFCNLPLLFVKLHFQLRGLPVEDLIPVALKLFTTHEFPVTSDAGTHLKHGRISIPELQIYFAHIPLPTRLIELFKINWQDIYKLTTYILQLHQEIVTVKLKGTVHYSTVVQGCHCEIVCRLRI